MKMVTIISLLFILCVINSTCIVDSSESSSQRQESVFLQYLGDFECDDIDADDAVFLYNQNNGSGWFGWEPSNGGRGTYAMINVDALSFNVTMNMVYGADLAAETETLGLNFQMTLSEDGNSISGSGQLTRPDGSIEECTIRFQRR